MALEAVHQPRLSADASKICKDLRDFSPGGIGRGPYAYVTVGLAAQNVPARNVRKLQVGPKSMHLFEFGLLSSRRSCILVPLLGRDSDVGRDDSVETGFLDGATIGAIARLCRAGDEMSALSLPCLGDKVFSSGHSARVGELCCAASLDTSVTLSISFVFGNFYQGHENQALNVDVDVPCWTPYAIRRVD